MSNEALVQLRTFAFAHEADLAASALEAHGIQASVRGRFLGGADPGLTAAMGGVALFVAARDAEAAEAILESEQPPSKPDDAAVDAEATCAGCGRVLRSASDACPDCNSLPDRVIATPSRTYWSLVKLKLAVVLLTLTFAIAPIVWDRFVRSIRGVPEKTLSLVLYLVVAGVVGLVLAKGLAARSDRRL